MTPEQKQFINLLGKIDYSKNMYEIFDDFCRLGTYSLALPFHGDIAREEISRVTKKYSTDQIKLFDEAFAIMVNELEKTHTDFLGEVFGECELANDRQGQFFTPFHVSLMMAKITFQGMKELIGQKGFITANEPACGSGGMMIAMRQVMIEEKCNPSRDVFIVAQDVSEIAFMMCYIQISLYGIGAKIIHGNTITLQTFRVLYTPVYWITDWPLRLMLRNARTGIDDNTQAKNEPDEVDSGTKNDGDAQLNLF